MAKTPCGLCGSLREKITKEHVFGEWIARLFGVGAGRFKMRHTLDREQGAVDEQS